MANASYETLEIRFVIEPDWTVCYVLLSHPADGTIGVGGWHAKRFPPRLSCLDILQQMKDGKEAGLLWPQEHPEAAKESVG